LGQQDRGKEQLLALRTRAFTCEGNNRSALLFVPFPDLVSRSPDTVLGAAFDVVYGWMQR
jgi:hypothetical protein